VSQFLDTQPVPESIPTQITFTTRRKFLRICNNLIVSKKTEGDPGVANPAGAGEHVQLDVSRGDLKRRLGVKNYVDWNLQVRALNLGTRAVETDLRLYEGPGDAANTYSVLKRYPPDADARGLVLTPGERRIYDLEQVPGQNDPEKKRPMFPVLFSIREPEFANQQTRAMAFFIDPDRKIPEANKRDNQASFFYYVLDLESGATPSPGNDPAPPIDDVRGDPLAIETARMSFSVTARRMSTGTYYGGKQISVGLFEQVQIKYEFRNLSSKALSNIWVMRDGVAVATLPSLAPMGQTGDRALITDPQLYIPTQAGTTIVRRTATAVDDEDNTVGQLHDSVSITATDAIQGFKVNLFDASPLAEPGHPFSRVSANRDEQQQEISLVGATTDGDPLGGGGRVRVEIDGLRPDTEATVSLVDLDLPNATDGLGWLQQDGDATTDPVVVTPGITGHVELLYVPPSDFVRDLHRAEDVQKTERRVGIRVTQTAVGSSLRQVVLRRPPVFLVHGLLSDRDTWNKLQPLVPSSGVGNRFAAVKGFDGRFDLFAVGSPFAGKKLAEEMDFLKTDIRLSLAGYLPGFAIGKVDVIGHSMGGVLIRRLTNDFVSAQLPVPFRKLIALDSPFRGSALAAKIREIRARSATKQTLRDTPQDYLKFISAAQAGEFGVDVKALFDVDKCAFAVQAIGTTPRFFTHGAVQDLEPGSVELQALAAAGIEIPSHHIVGITADPVLGVTSSPTIGAGLLEEVTLLWVVLGQFCNLTPEAETIPATILVQSSVDLTMFALSYSSTIGRIKELIPGRIPLGDITKRGEEMLREFGRLAKVTSDQAATPDPIPVFTGDNPENDRIVESTSQMGGLSADDPAVTIVQGYTDHTAIIESAGVPVSACDLSAPALSPPQPLNNDTIPDVVCRVIQLLESPAAGPRFKKDQ
jgi:pimeloyl-ACP methyl ester carboxylesterase